MDYELLSRLNCSEYGRFVRYEPTIYGSGISAYFKRKELENYILKSALETGVINHDAVMKTDGTKVDIWVEHTETTLGYYWADENEPIYFIHAQIYGPLEDSHMARKKCEYSFYVCAPFSGGYQIEHNNFDDGSKLFDIYSPKIAKRKGLGALGYYGVDDEDQIKSDFMKVYIVHLNKFMYDVNFYNVPYEKTDPEERQPFLRIEWKMSASSNVKKGQHVCTVIRSPNSIDQKVFLLYSPISGILDYESREWDFRYYKDLPLNVFSVFKRREDIAGYKREQELIETRVLQQINGLNSNRKEEDSVKQCYVYLMCDMSNGYYKIGISNQPEYRERTLQSEKPTIEKICAKVFPNRTIASAIESALHKAYESKRLRGEWFALDTDDVNAIISTLS